MSISVIIITHNRYEYACQALDSVLAQSLKADQIILVDDGSSFDFKARYQGDNPDLLGQIQFVRLNDLGPSAARNEGARVATSQYLTFLDDDDQMDPVYLETCFEIMNEEKADLIVTPMINFDETGKTWNGKSLPSTFNIDEVMLKNIGVVGSNMFMMREVFEEVGGFNSELKGSEDKDFFLRFMINNKKIIKNPKRLIRYRFHPETQVSGKNKFHKFQLEGKKRFYNLYKSKMKLKTKLVLYSTLQYFILNGESAWFDKLHAFMVLLILNPKYLLKTFVHKVGL